MKKFCLKRSKLKRLKFINFKIDAYSVSKIFINDTFKFEKSKNFQVIKDKQFFKNAQN